MTTVTVRLMGLWPSRPTREHRVFVKGKGRHAYAVCLGCATLDPTAAYVAAGPRVYVNRAARHHRQRAPEPALAHARMCAWNLGTYATCDCGMGGE